MTTKEIYIEISERFIESAEKQIDNNILFQEVLGFSGYHAFESIAGAFNLHIGQPVSLSHEKKLATFSINYRRNKISRIDPKAVGQLAILLNSMRNKFLYPENTPTGDISPKEQIKIDEIKKIVKQVKGIIKKLKEKM